MTIATTTMLLAAWMQAATATDLPRYLEPTPRVGTGGQPTPAGIRQLKTLGYDAVISLRTAGEGGGLAGEDKLVRDAGLAYFNIPVTSTDPREAQATEFLSLLERLKDRKVFVHCATANRVGGFMMIQWVVGEKMAPEQAEELAGRVGLKSEILREFARTYIQRRPQP